MKLIFSVSIMLLSWTTAMSQEVVFEKQFETARFNESRGSSSIVESLVKTTGPSDDAWATLAAIMSEKDGYVSIRKITEGIVVKHESWIPYKDIEDVLISAGVEVVPIPSELIESTE